MNEQKFEIEKSQDNLFMCFICQTKFDKYGLETHYMETHNDVQNENLNKSESFDKSLESGKLRTHIKTVHEGQKDFKCDSGGKSFAEAGSLRKHIKTGHGRNHVHLTEWFGFVNRHLWLGNFGKHN